MSRRSGSDTVSPQLSTLQRELAVIERQTSFESQKRQELEAALERDREAAAIPEEHVAAIRRREEEIERIREEKAAMAEWLQKGVAEAERISVEIETLKVACEQCQATEHDFTEDMERLAGMNKRLEIEIEQTRGRLLALREQKGILEDESKRNESVTGVVGDVVAEITVDTKQLAVQADLLRGRVRDVETVEIALGCLAASIRRALRSLEDLNRDVSRGAAVESDDDEDYDSGDDAETTRFAPVVLTSARATVSRCDGHLATLWSVLCRFDADEAQREQLGRRRHTELATEMRQDVANVSAACKKDIAALIASNNIREPQLRRYLQLRRDKMAELARRVDADELPASEAQFNLLKYISDENEALLKQKAELEATRDKWKAKTDAMEADYLSVREMKRMYRDMETQKAILSHQVRTAEHENREMKNTLWGTPMPAQTDRKGQQQQQQQHQRGKKPAWRDAAIY